MSGLQSIYIMTSRLQAQRTKLDSAAVNVANANTPGFKSQGVDFETIIGGRDSRPAGEFVHDRGFKTNYSQGTISPTGNPFDAAIIGNGFFAIEGANNGDPTYTRDGHFTLTPDGTLVNGQGQPVLDEGNAEITIPQGATVKIDTDGTISADGQIISRLGIFQFDENTPLLRIGDNQFRPEGGQPPVLAQNVQVMSGAVESSNVDPVLETVRMSEVNQAYQGAARLLSRMEDLEQRAIRQIPNVSN